MEEILIPLARMFERILAVGIGGLSIYLGYRLFAHLPFQHDSDGHLQVPGFSVVMSRIGPGVFFAGFGAVVMIYSFSHPVDTNEKGFMGISVAPLNKDRAAKLNDSNDKKSPTGEPTLSSGSGVAKFVFLQEQAFRSIRLLNCLERIAKARHSNVAEGAEFAVREAKIALLWTVWDNAWGDPGKLRQLGHQQPVDLPEALLGAYRAELSECPY